MPRDKRITDPQAIDFDPLVERGKKWHAAHDRWSKASRVAAPLYNKRDATIKERRSLAAALRRADKAVGAMQEVENFAIEHPPSSVKGALLVAEMIYDLVDHTEPEGALAESLISGLRKMTE